MTTVIACGQFTPATGDLESNISRMEDQARRARSMGAEVVVFPELCLCGYPEPMEAASVAVSVDGEAIGRLAEIARDVRIAVCFGFAEATPGGKLHNSMAFIGPEGRLRSVYRKTHLWDTEARWAAPGDRFESFDAGPFRCGIWICYDTRFPEVARILALSGAAAALVGSAWFGPAEEWELALRSRALDNGMFVAGAALQGSSGRAGFHGAGLIVDPHGRVIAGAAEGRDEVIAAECDWEVAKSFRARLRLLRDRRVDAFGALQAAGDWPEFS